MAGVALRQAAPWLARGCEAAGLTFQQGVERVVEREATLWMIVEGEKVRGAFLTEERIEEGSDDPEILTVYALAGDDAPRWASAADAAISEFTREIGHSRFRFIGKPGWARLLPGARITKRRDDGAVEFERVAA